MKLVVEVVDAHNLMPKDGEGSSSPFVEVDFVNQRSRSRTVHKNLNPVWNQKLLLNLEDPNSLHHNDIEVCVYNDRRSFPGRNFLGKVKIHGSNIVKKGEEALQRFQLEKKWFFSSVKGEIGLKIYISPESEPESPPTFNQPPLTPSPIVSSTTTSTDNQAASNIESIANNNNSPTVSIAEVTANTSKEFLSVSKTSSSAAVNDSLKVEANTSTATTTTIDSCRTTAAEKSEEPKETIVETRQYIHKHQASHQPGISVERPVSVPSTMHQINPQAHANRQEDFKLKDTSPRLGERWPNGGVRGGGGGWMSGERLASTYDLVEQMYYLYVRVVKAKELPTSSITGSCDPYIEVKLGNYKGTTRHFEKKINPEWNQVFAFSKDRIQSSMVEVFVKDKDMVGRDDYLGKVVFDLNEVPTRVPPDSPLAPQWYRLEERRGDGKVRGEIMLAVWMGTQADEAFPEAWHSDAASVHGEGVFNIRSKVYVSPKLWYLRVNVIEAQDVQPNDRSRLPDVFVKCQVGNQLLKTKVFPRAINPLWNEDLLFVAAEPFEEHLVLTVEDRVHQSKEEMVGKISLPLNIFEKRLDHRPVHSKWFNLEKFGFGVLEGDKRKELKFSSRIHLRVCLEGAYHVLDESTMYISDQRPTARQLWKQPIGILEVGILSANGLLPMKMKDGRGTTDAYCVAKYGQKWVRTRTIIDSPSPKWNEQYTWEVYDPCTVITLGVFDNCHLGGSEKPAGGGLGKDSRIGKIPP
ncbi:hypothetical protein AQUCO_01400848v1 [Aquilegia coerulea]|uniref:C2 domain-containing protein n=1 Tax=Aquilegia coerulea TaxID=218851 RepID=A0A2G5DYJ9_AQUCA|nr:hypothetical protein AQUCO_01400848v1 [Aquilegia coerulea]